MRFVTVVYVGPNGEMPVMALDAPLESLEEGALEEAEEAAAVVVVVVVDVEAAEEAEEVEEDAVVEGFDKMQEVTGVFMHFSAYLGIVTMSVYAGTLRQFEGSANYLHVRHTRFGRRVELHANHALHFYSVYFFLVST